MTALHYATRLGFFPFSFDKKNFTISIVPMFIKSLFLFVICLYVILDPKYESFLTSSLNGSRVLANSVRILTRVAWICADCLSPFILLFKKADVERVLTYVRTMCGGDSILSLARRFRTFFFGLLLFYGPIWFGYYCYIVVRLKSLNLYIILTYGGLNTHGLFASVEMLIYTFLVESVVTRVQSLQLLCTAPNLSFEQFQALADDFEQIQLWMIQFTKTFGPNFCLSILSCKITHISYFYTLYEGHVASKLDTQSLVMYNFYTIFSQVVALWFTHFFYWKFSELANLVS